MTDTPTALEIAEQIFEKTESHADSAVNRQPESMPDDQYEREQLALIAALIEPLATDAKEWEEAHESAQKEVERMSGEYNALAGQHNRLVEAAGEFDSALWEPIPDGESAWMVVDKRDVAKFRTALDALELP